MLLSQDQVDSRRRWALLRKTRGVSADEETSLNWLIESLDNYTESAKVIERQRREIARLLKRLGDH